MTIAENVITVVEGVPVFKNEGVMWPHLIAERPQGPSSIVSTVIRIASRDEKLTNFRTSSANGELTWLAYKDINGNSFKAHVVAMGPLPNSEEHLVFWLQEEVINPEKM